MRAGNDQSDVIARQIDVIDRLYQVIEQRRVERPRGSHTAKLFRRGTGKIAQKVGEEAVETVIAAMRGDRAELIAESADLIYHLLVLWADAGVTPDQVWRELSGREKGDPAGAK